MFFLGLPRCEKRISSIESTVSSIIDDFNFPKSTQVQRFLFALVDASSYLSAGQKHDAVMHINNFIPAANTLNKTQMKKLVTLLNKFSRDVPASPMVTRHPVTFILDKEVQNLPFESMKIVADQPISRVPSLFFLVALYKTHEMNKNSVTKEGVKLNKIYYVLNPNNDIKNTQDRLEGKFKAEVS